MPRIAVILSLVFPLLVAPTSRAACITDDTGTEVCVEGAPTRVVSLYGAFTELVWTMGAGEDLVARTKNDTTIPEVVKLPSVGTGLRPNVEYLLALRPDLVIGRASRAGRRAVGPLRQRGVTVAAFDPKGLDDLYGVIERLGTLLGCEPGARALAGRLRTGIEAVRARARGLEPVRVVYEVRAQPLTVAGQGNLVSELLEVAGGTNVVESPKKLVRLDPELLLKLDSEAYLIQEGPMNRNPTPLAGRPHFALLTAAKTGRTLIVNEQEIARPGPHVAEAAETLLRFLHPEAAIRRP